MDAHSLGKLCLERGLITEPQLERCLELQRSGERWRRLGEILLEQGLVTGSGFARMLELQRARRGPAEEGEAEIEPPTHELGWLLREARAWGADAVVLGTGRPPAFRCGRRLDLLEGPPLRAGQVEQMLAEAFSGTLLQRLRHEQGLSLRGRLDADTEVAVELYRCRGGVAAVLRPIPGAPPSIADLGLPEGVAALADRREGLVLIAGPAGSGKRTTQFALLDRVNAGHAVQIDVVERIARRRLAPRSARVTHRTAGHGPGAFLRALEAARRGEADVIALDRPGRAAEIGAMLDAADGGRLVVATLPTRSALSSVQWVLHAFGDDESGRRRAQLARCLRGVVCQQRFEARGDDAAVVAVELMPATPAVAQAVRGGQVDRLPVLLHADRSGTMIPLEQSLAALCRGGRLTFEEAMAHANEPAMLQRLLRAPEEAAHGNA